MNYNNLKEREFPKEDDRLFKGSKEDWQNNAVLNYPTNKFYPYADGYKEGAQRLIKECVENDGTKDTLIYPIVFLYRQYLELRLKEVIIGLHYCLSEPANFPKSHRLDIIWDEFIRLYLAIGEDVSSKEFVMAKVLISEFSQIDLSSMTFRYPVDKEGKEFVKPSHISITNFGEVMDRLSNLLDSIADQIANFRDIASEIYGELYSNYY